MRHQADHQLGLLLVSIAPCEDQKSYKALLQSLHQCAILSYPRLQIAGVHFDPTTNQVKASHGFEALTSTWMYHWETDNDSSAYFHVQTLSSTTDDRDTVIGRRLYHLFSQPSRKQLEALDVILCWDHQHEDPHDRLPLYCSLRHWSVNSKVSMKQYQASALACTTPWVGLLYVDALDYHQGILAGDAICWRGSIHRNEEGDVIPHMELERLARHARPVFRILSITLLRTTLGHHPSIKTEPEVPGKTIMCRLLPKSLVHSSKTLAFIEYLCEPEQVVEGEMVVVGPGPGGEAPCQRVQPIVCWQDPDTGDLWLRSTSV